MCGYCILPLRDNSTSAGKLDVFVWWKLADRIYQWKWCRNLWICKYHVENLYEDNCDTKVNRPYYPSITMITHILNNLCRFVFTFFFKSPVELSLSALLLHCFRKVNIEWVSKYCFPLLSAIIAISRLNDYSYQKSMYISSPWVSTNTGRLHNVVWPLSSTLAQHCNNIGRTSSRDNLRRTVTQPVHKTHRKVLFHVAHYFVTSVRDLIIRRSLTGSNANNLVYLWREKLWPSVGRMLVKRH